MIDAAQIVQELKSQTRVVRKRRYGFSRLDRYTAELLELRAHGASIAELQRWLRTKRIKVNHSTVSRWLTKHG